MNWRKGFFRAWVVFTVLWIAGAITLNYNSLNTYLKTGRELSLINSEFTEINLEAPWFGIANSNGEISVTAPNGLTIHFPVGTDTATIEGAMRKAWPQFDNPPPPGFVLDKPKTSDRSELEALRRIDKEKQVQEEQYQSLKGILQINSIITLAIPAALLALGTMIAWVFSGFRKEQA